MKEYYKILQVSRNASQHQIKEQYRSLVREYHPDKFLDEEEKQVAKERFVKITEAYNALKADFPSVAQSEYVDPNQPPVPLPSRTLLNFGQMPIGSRKTITFIVRNDGGPVESVRFDYDKGRGWVKVEEQTTKELEGKFPLKVAVTVDTDKMTPQSSYQDQIDIWFNDQMARVTLIVTVTEQQQLLQYFSKLSPQLMVFVFFLVATLAGIFAFEQMQDEPVIFASNSADGASAAIIADDEIMLSALASPLLFSRGSEQKTLYIMQETVGKPYSLQQRGYAPSWSPTAHKVAFLRDTSKGTHIFTADLVITQPLSNTLEVSDAGFGVYPPEANANTAAPAQLRKFAASKAMQLTSSPSPKHGLVWSPNGQQIAYREQFKAEDGSVTNLLKAIDLETANESLLSIPSQGNVTHATWSQDSQSLYATFNRNGQEKIYVVDAASGFDEAFVQFESRDAAWSPDGKVIAVASDQGIYLVDKQQDTVERLSAFSSWEPKWSPDGSKLAFHGVDDSDGIDVLPTKSKAASKENADLWLLDIGTGMTTQVTRSDVYTYLWDSIGEALFYTSMVTESSADGFYVWQVEPGKQAKKLTEISTPQVSWLTN